MNADERNVLVALMHPANSVNHRQAGAIRSALATIDALNEELGCERSRVANLVSRITGKPGDTTNEAVGEASREALALREQVATLTDARNELQDLFNICDGERLFLKEQVERLTVERDEALARAMNAETEASIFREDLAGAVAALHGEPQPRGMTDVGLDLFYGIEALKSGTTPRVKENP